jgi:TonB family protein
MPITQIPFQDPVAPPEKPQPEQLGLYDTQDWETAYRELDDRVPHLVIQLQDDLARSRRREAAWISIIVHLIVFIALWQSPLIGKYMPWHRAVAVALTNKDKNLTMLALPPDLQKATRKPNTNIASDKDRIAMTRHPELDPKELKKILATPPPGRPGMSGPRTPQAPPETAQNQPPSQQPQGQPQQTTRPQFESNQTAQLQTPAQPKNSFSKYTGGMSAGSAIQQATQAVAAGRGGGGQEGDYGLGTGAKGRQLGPLEILSDTQGVDFGPYLQRLVQEVKDHWYELIPESASMKRGKLKIEFAIMKDGSVRGLRVAQSSGDIALDRPAYGSITGSDPFPPLPSEFGGPFLKLQFTYYYLANNPDPTDLQ